MCIERAGKIHITRRSRGIHAAWHFWYAVSLGGESTLRKVGLGGIHPLTRRYEASLFSLEIYDEKRTSLSITSASLWLLSES